MPWSMEASAKFAADYRKLCGKNAGFRRAVDKQVEQVLGDPAHSKPLRAPRHGVRRAHVQGAFVLLFEEVRSDRVVRFLRLARHDEAYGL